MGITNDNTGVAYVGDGAPAVVDNQLQPSLGNFIVDPANGDFIIDPLNGDNLIDPGQP